MRQDKPSQKVLSSAGTYDSRRIIVRYAMVGIITFVLGASVWGVVYLNKLGQEQIYEQREVTNESFKMRITAYKEKGVLLPGVYFVFRSALSETDKWQDVITVKGDEPISIRPQQLGFVGPRIGYGFIGSYYMVTTDAGNNWSIWHAEKQLFDDEYKKRNNLSPYIEEILIQPDGTGRMRLYQYFSERERGSDLFTTDYGLHWYFKE